MIATRRRESLLPKPRKENQELVIRLLSRHGSLRRSQLIAMTGLSRTTLYDIVASLIADGVIEVSVPPSTERKRGRPVEELALNPQTSQVLGIDFSQQAVRVAVGLVDEIIGTASKAHPSNASWRDRVGIAYRLVESLRGRSLGPGALSRIGVGVMGPVAASGSGGPGTDMHAAISSMVQEQFGTKVLLDSSTRLATLAEWEWGAAAGESDVLYLQLSRTVGGGLVVGGTLHRGASGLAGEFGHIAADPQGAACSCGSTGCLETVASVGAVLRSYRAAGGVAETLPQLITATKQGDRTAREVLAKAGTGVGRALSAIANAVGLNVIVVGGELATAGGALMDPIKRQLDRHVTTGQQSRVSLRPAKLGDMSTALGAIALPMQDQRPLSQIPVRRAG